MNHDAESAADANRAGTRILMCAPKHFAVDYAINPWMDPADWAKNARALGAEARRQWQALTRKLKALGATIENVPPVPGLPDMVFTANAAVVMDGVALVASFRHPERRGETAHFEAAFRALWARGLVDAVRTMPEGVILEGAGDCVWDQSRRLFWMGYGQRSDYAAAQVVRDHFGLAVVPLKLANPCFYHMDTALAPLPHGEVMYIPSAFTAGGLAAIRARIAPADRIELADDDANRLAANAVKLGDDIVLSGCSGELRHDLEVRGYRVQAQPLGAFQKSGGSAFCLTLRLDLKSSIEFAVSAPQPKLIGSPA